MEKKNEIFHFGVEDSKTLITEGCFGSRGQLGNINQSMFPPYNPHSDSQFSSTPPVGNEFFVAESGSFSKYHHGFSYDHINTLPDSKSESFHSTYINNFYSPSAFSFNPTTLPTSQQSLLPAGVPSTPFFKNEHADVVENRNQKVSRQLMVHPPIEDLNDVFKDAEIKLIIQKELSNSDVGTVGRIVLPKKEAEANLPPLTEREGIILNMNDPVLPVTWKFKYRFWPNNKSRMYIMESTGGFVKAHGLQAGDLFIIFKSLTTENYVVRGIKRVIMVPNAEPLHSAYRNDCCLNQDCINQQREDPFTDETLIHYSSPVDFQSNNTGFHQFSQQGIVPENSFGDLLP